jgi:hypothetical protein
MNFHDEFGHPYLRVLSAANAAPGGRNMNYMTPLSAVFVIL